MPMRDHFHSPLSDRHPWEAVHGQWPALIVLQLNELLPPKFRAMPQIHLGSSVEIDVGAFDEDFPAMDSYSDSDEGGVATATAVWAPPEATLTIETDSSEFDEYEVRIYDTEEVDGPQKLVAAIEIISPANKNRPQSRAQFVAKCADLLAQDVSVSLVDLVTSRHFNLYEEVLNLLGVEDPSLRDAAPATYAVTCRWPSRKPRGARRRMESWHYPLTVGRALPCLPVWLRENWAIPLELDAGYERTCRALRIP